MSILAWLFFALFLSALASMLIIFNHLAQLKNNAKNERCNLDELLTQRHEEFPQLINLCNKYLPKERDSLDKILSARALTSNYLASSDIDCLGNSEALLEAALQQLFDAVEEYSQQTYQSVIRTLRRMEYLEKSIKAQQISYNTAVTACNSRIRRFPHVVVALIFGFRKLPMVERKTNLKPISFSAAISTI